jgi:Protein of unknown function (DUF2802)
MPSWIPVLSIPQLPFPVSLELLLIAGRAVALVGALCVFAWGFSRWRQSMARDTQRVFEQLDLIHGELHGLAEAAAVIASRLDALNDKVAMNMQLAPVQGTSGQRAYENAIRLAQRGVSPDDLVSQCGLSRHEADLLVRLHGRSDERSRSQAEERSADDGATVPRKRLAVVG